MYMYAACMHARMHADSLYIRRPLARCLEPTFSFLWKIPLPLPLPGESSFHFPRDPGSVSDAPTSIFFCIFFWHSFRSAFFSFLVPFLLQLASQLGPKIHPTSLQEPFKIHPKSHLVFDALLDRFLVDFWSNLAPTWKLRPPKSVIRIAFLVLFVFLLQIALDTFLLRFWIQLGSILGGFWLPSWSQLGHKTL